MSDSVEKRFETDIYTYCCVFLLAAWLLNQHTNRQELNYCIYFVPYIIYVLLLLLFLLLCASVPLTLLLHVCFVALFDFDVITSMVSISRSS